MALRSSSRAPYLLFLGSSALLLALVWQPAHVCAESPTVWRSEDGDSLVHLRGWLITDVVGYERTEKDYGPSWHVSPELANARVSLRFQLFRDWGGRVDGEFSSANPDAQEAWFEFRRWELLTLRAGRIKVPFGMSPQVNAPQYLLMDAPMVMGNSKDFRDVGFMVLGDWKEGYIGYSFAAVTGSRDLSVEVNDKPDVVGRLILHPPSDSSYFLRGLHLGVSATYGDGPTRNGFRGRTLAGHTFANPPTVRGNQTRLGAELEWDTPLFRLSSEYVRTVQKRQGVTQTQKVGTSFLPVGNLEGYEIEGWYVEGMARLFGEPPEGDWQHSGLELCGRYERFDYGDGTLLFEGEDGVEDRAPLADSWIEGVTAGVNYWVTNQVRLSLVWQGLRFGDPAVAPNAPLQSATGDIGSEGEEDASPLERTWVHHLFFRAQFTL